MFATLNDLALRLGVGSEDDLTATQTAQGTMLLGLATGMIAETAGRDTEWADELDPVPEIVRGVCLEMVARVMEPLMRNPAGASSQSKTIGSYSETTRFESGGSSAGVAAGLNLTDSEALMVRRALIGTLSGSAYLPSMLRTATIEEPVGYAPVEDLWTE